MRISSVKCLIMGVILSGHIHAQERGCIDYYTVAPEKYLNKKVTIFITRVSLPAKNDMEKDDFKVFEVNTSDIKNNGIYSYDYKPALVKVPSDKAEAFVKRYNQGQGSSIWRTFTPRQAIGVFRHGDKNEANCPSSLKGNYYIDMGEEKEAKSR